MKKFNNEIIIIGGNHHNMLGVARSLGIKGYKSTAIITCENDYAYVGKSKYFKDKYVIREDENKIMAILMKIKDGLNDKAFIIPTSDFAAFFIDENYNKLSKYFILPSINEEEGLITKYMDKYNQFLLAKDNKIKMAKCVKIDLGSFSDYESIEFNKCILKPIVSANGKKSDIRICMNKEELFCSLNELKNIGYNDILVQEYIEFDLECGLIGCAHGKNIILPGIIKKERIYPPKRGSNSYAHIEKLVNNTQIEKIKKLILKMNYSGMFDIEIFIKNNVIYLNEINFRNSGNTFAYCYNNVFIIYLWMLLKLEIDISDEKISVSENFDYIDENLERKQLLHRNITIIEFLKTRKKAKARLFSYKNDFRVDFYKFIYAIKKRIMK